MKIQNSKPDRNKIDLSDDETMRRWAKNFGKTHQEIAVAIDKVGNAAAAVRKELSVKTPTGT
jgi:ribosome biogenesis GTPase A